MDNKARSDSRGHFEQDGIDYDEKQAKGEDRQRKGDDFQEQAKCRVYHSEDRGRDERCPYPVHFEAGNNVSNNQQRNSVDKPANQEPHRFPSSPAGSPTALW